MKVEIFRDSLNTAWGFRLQGGKDVKQPLTVQRVFTNSPAEGELHRGDVIISINGRDTSQLNHVQALDLIKFGGGQLEFQIERPPAGRIRIEPLKPTVQTKAPSLPSPTKTSFSFPIQFSPPFKQQAAYQPPPPIESAPPFRTTPMPSGHNPRKLNVSRLGGGGPSFGADYTHVAPRHVPAQPPPQPGYGSSQQYDPDMLYDVKESLDNIVLSSPTKPSPEYGQDEEDYPRDPVSIRRRNFMGNQPAPQPLRHANVPHTVPRPKPGPSQYSQFGTDYGPPTSSYKRVKPPGSPTKKTMVTVIPQSSPQAYQSSPQAYQSSPQAYQPSTDVPDAYNQTWRDTLRASSDLKPWERDQLMAQQEGGPPQTYQSSPSSQYSPAPQAAQDGERDWNQSYVYRMIHDDDGAKQTRAQAPAPQAPPPQAAPRSPQPVATSYASVGLNDALGVSDF